MTDFILLLIVGACWIWGVHCIFSDGYVLMGLGRWIRGKVDAFSKPLFDCPPCMSSFHGIMIAAVYYDWHIYPMMAYIICLCGLNFILKSIIYPEYE